MEVKSTRPTARRFVMNKAHRGGASIAGSQIHSLKMREKHGPEAVRNISLPKVGIQEREFDQEGYDTWMKMQKT